MTSIRRRLTPYGLLGPGLFWLVVFFVVPMYFMARIALYEGSSTYGYTFAWNWSNFSDALTEFDTQFLRSFFYAGVATALALLIAYPLAYAIAMRGGKWKTLLLFAVVAPFFTTYLIRTLAWQTILSDQSFIVDFLRTIGLVADDGRVLDTSASVIAGLTYNFLPFMILPIYASLERVDLRLIEAAKDLYSSASAAFWRVTLPLTAPGVVAGVAADVHPGDGRLHQRRVSRLPEPGDDRQRDPVAVPRAHRLPVCGGALVRAHGPDPGGGRDLHPLRRDRGLMGEEAEKA